MNTNHVNNLTAAQAERLTILIEEMGEAIQAASKVLRHGYDSHHPDSEALNRNDLEKELGDVRFAMIHLCETGDLTKKTVHKHGALKRLNIRPYVHYTDVTVDPWTPLTCIGCGCTDEEACIDEHGHACLWLAVDVDTATGVCSCCEDHLNDFELKVAGF